MTTTSQNRKPLATVVMAAGQGKRMQDPTKPKVLYPLAGEPLVSYVVRLAERIKSDRTIVIVGYGRDQVTSYLKESFPTVETAIQSEQLGTGHAVQQTETQLADFTGDVLVLSGDVPLLRQETAESLIDLHRTSGALATVLSVEMENPFGYGRIVRSDDGKSLLRIVEEKDADEKTKAIREINSGIYLFDAKTLYPLLKGLRKENAQGEYYLTDVFAAINEQFGPGKIAVSMSSDPIEVTGVNTKDHLTQLEQEYLARVAKA